MNRPLKTAWIEAVESDSEIPTQPEWMNGISRSEGWRKFFHIVGNSVVGILAVLIVGFAYKVVPLLVALVLFTAHEFIRRNMRQFGEKLESSRLSFLVTLSHKTETIHREDEIGTRTGSTDCLWGVLSALLLTQFFDATPALSTAAFILAWSDPAGGVIGKRWGRFKIPWSNKTLLGSTTVFAVSFLIVWLTVFCYRPEMTTFETLGICSVVAAVASFAEWIPSTEFRIGSFGWKTPVDNFWMMLLVTAAFTAVW